MDQYGENDHITQVTQFQCNPYQNFSDILHRNINNLKFHMEIQKTTNTQCNPEKSDQ
jgi:hypothetical protein